ncbi:MAG: CdaR family protein [Sphaerochaetaceae bacterium]
MKMNDLIRTIRHNWPVKVISFVLALAIYMVIHYTTMATSSYQIPLNVIEPEGYTIVSTVEQTVQLNVTGDKKYIYMVNPKAVTATADFSQVNESGVAVRNVILSYDDSLFDIDVTFSTDPESIKIFFEESESTQEAVK